MPRTRPVVEGCLEVCKEPSLVGDALFHLAPNPPFQRIMGWVSAESPGRIALRLLEAPLDRPKRPVEICQSPSDLGETGLAIRATPHFIQRQQCLQPVEISRLFGFLHLVP